MKFYYRRIFHHEKNKYPGFISSVIRYKIGSNYDLERFDVRNDLTYPINLDDYELLMEELDRDRSVLYNRLLNAMELLDSTPIIHFTDEMRKRKVYPGDRYSRLSLCIFSSKEDPITSLYLEGNTDELFDGHKLFPLTRTSHYYKSKVKPKAGRPRKK